MKRLKESKLLQSLGHNTLPKVVCLLLAIITWFIVMDNKNPVLETVYRDVPVDLIGIEQVENRGMIIEHSSGDKVDVTVSGRWRDIIKLRDGSIYLSASLDTIVGKGINKILIDRRISSAGVTIVSLSRDSVELNIDAIETVKKPLEVEILGDLPGDLEMGVPNYRDEDILVTGPSQLLKDIAYLHGQLDISQLSASTTEHINLVPRDVDGNEVEGVELEATALAISIPVIGTKTLPLEIITEGEIRTNFRLTDKSANFTELTLKGDTNLLGTLTEIRSKPISIRNADKSFESMLEVDLPKDLTLIETEALTAKITIEALDNKRFNIPAREVKLLGTSDNFSYEIDKDLLVSLEVKDIRDVIKDIDEKTIKLETDVDGLTQGEYMLQIAVKGIPISSHYNVSELPLIIKVKGQ